MKDLGKYEVVLTDYNLVISKSRKNGHDEFIIPKENILRISAEQKDLADSLIGPKVFVDAQNLNKAIVVTLKDEPYNKLVVEVNDPEEAISRLRSSIS
jgi:hypothetical protein